MTRALRLSALLLVLASPTMPGAIQSAARAQVTAQAQPQMGYQTITSEQAPAWSRDAAQELLAYVQHIGQEGLNPSDYGADRLRAAIAGNDDAALTQVATPIFIRLAQDLSGGAVRGRARVEWHMTDATLDRRGQRGLPPGVARGGGAGAALDPLPPTHPQYAGLKRPPAAPPESAPARRALTPPNMERWRWMPRTLGPRHVLVNVPAFTAALI